MAHIDEREYCSHVRLLGMAKQGKSIADLAMPAIIGMAKPGKSIADLATPAIIGMAKPGKSIANLATPAIIGMAKPGKSIADLATLAIIGMAKPGKSIANLAMPAIILCYLKSYADRSYSRKKKCESSLQICRSRTGAGREIVRNREKLQTPTNETGECAD